MKRLYCFLLACCCSTLSLHAQHFVIADSLEAGAYGTAAWGDYDADGKKDLVYITQTLLPNTPNIFSIYHNNNGTLAKVPQVFPSLSLPAVAWGDLDNDGKDDLVVSGMGDTGLVLLIYKSNGDGTFTLKNDTLRGMAAGSLSIADYNNDGKNDIATTGQVMDLSFVTQTLVLKNEGNFVFRTAASLPGIYRGEIKWYDYDQDGKTDLSYNGVAAGEHPLVFIFHNEGNDSFQQVNGHMKGSIDGTLDWIDYDGNGKKDLLVTGVDSTAANTFTDLYRNNGDGSFTMVSSNLTAFGEPSAADIADFNNDGKPDICLGGGSNLFPNAEASVFYNAGNTSFTPESLPSLHMQLITNCIIAAADIDNDGDQDLLCAHYILKNTSGSSGLHDNTLQQIGIYPIPAHSYLLLNNPLGAVSMALTDITGRHLFHETYGKGLHKIDVSSYTPGTYYLQLSTKAGAQLNKPVVITH